jgi:hypothetical protein
VCCSVLQCVAICCSVAVIRAVVAAMCVSAIGANQVGTNSEKAPINVYAYM